MNTYFIRAVGQSQETWQTEALNKYIQRLRPYAKVTVIELHEGHEGATKPNKEKTQASEAESLLKSLPADATIIALDETGKNLSSPELAGKIQNWTDGGRPIVFVIGGSWGLSEEVRKRALFTLSFGKHTLPHVLARIVLLEQLYRAETILAGKTYHK